MLVITNPATQGVADIFAAAKRAQGWRTNVFQTGAGAGQIGTTPAQIQAFIRGRLTALLCIHPSYVTIMGDDDLVPTFTDGPSGIPSDLKYSLKTDADELPDLAIGRILGNDQAAITNAVSKIIGYETTAPTGNGMLTKALDRRAVPGRRQRRPGEPDVHHVRRDRPQRAHRPRRRRRPHLRRAPRQQPAALPGRQRAAGRAAEADVRLERHRRAGERRLERGPLHGRAPRPRLV